MVEGQCMALMLGAVVLLSLTGAAISMDPNGHQHHVRATPKQIPAWATSTPYCEEHLLYTTMSKVEGKFKVIHNAWWHTSRFYAKLRLQDMAKTEVVDDGLSVNSIMTRLAVDDMPAYVRTARAAYIPGLSIFLDYPFQGLPGHLGHWAEQAVPLYSVLQQEEWMQHLRVATKKKALQIRLVLPNLNRGVSAWFKAILQTALSPLGITGVDGLPTIVDYAEMHTFDKLGWLVFENLLVVDDRYTHPQNKRGFVSHDHGDLWRYDNCQRYVSASHSVRFAEPQHGVNFRKHVWQLAGLPPPPTWQPGSGPAAHLPQHITLLLPAGEDWPGIANHEALRDLLHELAAPYGWQVRVMTVSHDASLGTHLEAANTGLLVGRHAGIMANSMLLPPGAGVLELLPYKWEWAKLSMLYFNITQSIGDIHHFAWRPPHYKFAVFKNSSDLKYHTWTPVECHAYECLNKLRHAQIIADLQAISSILKDKLAGIVKGVHVDELREPWPDAV